MDSGSLVSRFLTGQLRKSIGAYKIISRVKCWYNLIFLYFFVEIFSTGVQKGREGKVQIPFPSPFRTLVNQAIFGLDIDVTFVRVARGFSNPVIPIQISA